MTGLNLSAAMALTVTLAVALTGAHGAGVAAVRRSAAKRIGAKRGGAGCRAPDAYGQAAGDAAMPASRGATCAAPPES